MDQGIWATWYDLEPGEEDRFLSWLHGEFRYGIAENAPRLRPQHAVTPGRAN